MSKTIVLLACSIVGAGLYFVGCGSPSCEETLSCIPDGGDGGGDVVSEPPPGCDLTKDPKDAPACVADAVGIFVDGTSGADANPGTKEKPVATITHALSLVTSPQTRVYVCA